MRLILVLAAALALCACSSSSSPNTREEALTYARDHIACTSTADCCAVQDGCLARMLLVSAADRDTVTQLLADAPMDMCLACITPPVQVDCRQGECVMVAMTGGDYNDVGPFMQDHCGALELPAGWTEAPASVPAGPRSPATVIGCGD
ncbi:MAG TPA: hypothetical protein VGQ83_30385 [Polyangia bacterium]|jgi:hypothetical protein